VIYVDNSATNGTYTYLISQLTNSGPVAEDVVTPADHTVVDPQTNIAYPAGGLLLNDDEQIFQFGIDTLNDEVVITDVTSGSIERNGQDLAISPLVGAVWDGLVDSDNNGVNNKVIVWELPHQSDISNSLQIGESVHWVMFVTDHEVIVWVQGSDDNLRWSNGLMLRDHYGNYDATAGVYLSAASVRGGAITPALWQ